MRKLDPISFVYAVLLLAALVKIADWVAPYENLTVQACRLNYVYDGDTVALDCGAKRETARLVGFDAPEAKSPGCAAEKAHAALATERLRALSKAGEVTFSGHARDKYRRLLVTMKVDGRDVGPTLIDEGLAVSYNAGKRIDWCAKLGT